MSQLERIGIRVEPNTKVKLIKAAFRSEKNLSTWMRDVLSKAADRILKRSSTTGHSRKPGRDK